MFLFQIVQLGGNGKFSFAFFFFLPSAKIVQPWAFMVLDSAGCQMQVLPFAVWLDIFKN